MLGVSVAPSLPDLMILHLLTLLNWKPRASTCEPQGDIPNSNHNIHHISFLSSFKAGTRASSNPSFPHLSLFLIYPYTLKDFFKREKRGIKSLHWEGPIGFFSEKIHYYGEGIKAMTIDDNIDLQSCKESFSTFPGAINLTEGEDLG